MLMTFSYVYPEILMKYTTSGKHKNPNDPKLLNSEETECVISGPVPLQNILSSPSPTFDNGEHDSVKLKKMVETYSPPGYRANRRETKVKNPKRFRNVETRC